MIKIVETKSFVLALLTLVAAVAGYEGLNIPIATIMGLLTPLMIAIGAAGWSDVAQMKAKLALEHEVKMHALEKGAVTHAELLAGKSVPAPRVGDAQAGFAKVGVMALIAVVFSGALVTVSLVSTNTGCGAVPPPIVTDTVDCVKAEAVVLTNGFNLLQLVNEVYGDIKSEGFLGALETLVTKYGSDVVACIIDSYPASAPSGSGASLSAEYGKKQTALQKFAPGKKFNHGTAK